MRKGITKKTIITCVFFLFGLIMIGAAIFLIIKGLHLATTNKQSSDTSETILSKTLEKANNSVNSNNPSQAITILDAAIRTTTKPDDLASLYQAKANAQVAAGDTKDALASALEAVKIAPTVLRFETVAQVYVAMGDKTNAIVYYKKALKASIDDKNVPADIAASDQQEYKDEITSLGGTVN